MEKKFRVIDIVLTVVLVAVMCIGIVYICCADRSGELTLENYEKYLTIRHYSKHEGNKIKYTVVFEQSPSWKLENVNITFIIEDNSLGRRQEEVSFDEKYEFVTYVDYKPETYEEAMNWRGTRIAVISINGQYSRGQR